MLSDVKDERKHPRVDLDTKVHLEFEKFSGFITEYSQNISEGGMFVKSKAPLPVGTVVSFEFKLKDNFSLIQGMGQVTWVRSNSVDPNSPNGMGIRFRELSPQSKQLISTMVQNVLKKGGAVFDIDSVPEQSPIVSTNPTHESFDLENDPTLTLSNEDETISMSQPLEEKKQEISKEQLFDKNFESMFKVEKEDPRTQKMDTDDDVSTSKLIEDALGQIDETQNTSTALDNSQPQSIEPADDLVMENSSETKILNNKESKKNRKKWPILIFVVLALFALGYFVLQKFILNEPGLDKVQSTPVVSPTKKPTVVQTPEPQANDQASNEQSISPTPDMPTPAKEEQKVQEDVEAIKSELNELAKSPTQEPKVEATISQKAVVTEKPTASAQMKPTTVIEPQPSNLTRIKNIAWTKAQDKLLVVIETSVDLNQESFEHIRIEQGAVRELVKIKNIEQPFSKRYLTINTMGVSQVRTGFHAQTKPPSLHLVFDLDDKNMAITSIEPTGQILKIYFKSKQTETK